MFLQHEKTSIHQSQCQKPGQKVQKKLTPSSFQDTLGEDAIMSRILSAWWLAKQDIAMHKFGSHLDTQAVMNCQSPSKSYRDDRVAWEIVEILGDYFRGLLKGRVRKSPFFGIMVDETTDTSTSAQLILYIKFLDKIDGEFVPIVEYLDLISPASNTAEDLTVFKESELAYCRQPYIHR